MTFQQLQIMILYLLGFHTDEYMNILYGDSVPFMINGLNVYIEDGVSDIPSMNRFLLNIIYDIYSIIPIFEFYIYNKSRIRVHYYYTEVINKHITVYIKTDSMTIQSASYKNRCLAYIDILLKLNNVNIDLKQFER